MVYSHHAALLGLVLLCAVFHGYGGCVGAAVFE
jgi:hypothetical protein